VLEAARLHKLVQLLHTEVLNHLTGHLAQQQQQQQQQQQIAAAANSSSALDSSDSSTKAGNAQNDSVLRWEAFGCPAAVLEEFQFEDGMQLRSGQLTVILMLKGHLDEPAS
jgi:hypothetical protein